MVVVRDTYEALGAGGYHLQTPDAVAAALERDGAGTGGVLLLAPARRRAELEAALAGVAVDRSLWSNGSPEPAA